MGKQGWPPPPYNIPGHRLALYSTGWHPSMVLHMRRADPHRVPPSHTSLPPLFVVLWCVWCGAGDLEGAILSMVSLDTQARLRDLADSL